MPALESGVLAPEINLSFLDGKKFSLKEALKHGPVVVAFFKVNCPVCQFAFPYLERIFKAYGASQKFALVGVSLLLMRGLTLSSTASALIPGFVVSGNTFVWRGNDSRKLCI